MNILWRVLGFRGVKTHAAALEAPAGIHVPALLRGPPPPTSRPHGAAAPHPQSKLEPGITQGTQALFHLRTGFSSFPVWFYLGTSVELWCILRDQFLSDKRSKSGLLLQMQQERWGELQELFELAGCTATAVGAGGAAGHAASVLKQQGRRAGALQGYGQAGCCTASCLYP